MVKFAEKIIGEKISDGKSLLSEGTIFLHTHFIDTIKKVMLKEELLKFEGVKINIEFLGVGR